MNKKQAYERAANVLFYGSLDEPFALKRAIHPSRENSDFDQLCILHELLEKKQNVQHVHAKGIEEGRVQLKKNLRLDYWREFKYNSSKDILLPILYKWIGEFEDTDIKNVLGLSFGTLNMRYNEGLIKLGGYLVKEVSVE